MIRIKAMTILHSSFFCKEIGLVVSKVIARDLLSEIENAMREC